MVAGSKMSRGSLKCLAVATAIAGLQCGGKTTIFLGTSPGEASTAEGGIKIDGAGPNGLGLGGSLGSTDCGGTKTTVSGVVYDPAGKVPLYNVLVYVPGADDVVPPQEGLACGPCSVNISAVDAKLTDEAGRFQLEVPAGDQLLVMQIGKWFRTRRISVKPCQETTLSLEDTRLPRDRSEGHLPRIAVTTGHSDTLECLLRRIGINDTEFTTDQDPNGHVHMFVGCPNPDADNHIGASEFIPTLNGGAKFSQATTLWSDFNKLSQYDMVVMSCEGTQCDKIKDDTMHTNIKKYADNGGRLFLSHDQFVWLKSGPAPWPKSADYVGADRDPLPSPFVSQIDDTFPKGSSFSRWLGNVNGAITPGHIQINNARFSVRAANPPMTQQWIYTTDNPSDSSHLAVEYLTMNTPVAMTAMDTNNVCGRVVFTDLHLLPTEPLPTSDVSPFPSACDLSPTLSAQELALEFMMFDLSSCVLPESKTPEPPAIVR